MFPLIALVALVVVLPKIAGSNLAADKTRNLEETREHFRALKVGHSKTSVDTGGSNNAGANQADSQSTLDKLTGYYQAGKEYVDAGLTVLDQLGIDISIGSESED